MLPRIVLEPEAYLKAFRHSSPKDVDPFAFRISGPTGFKEPEFYEASLISHIEGNLYQGGTIEGVELPRFIEHVISLFPWESYRITHPLKTMVAIEAYDEDVRPLEPFLDGLASLVVSCVRSGPTAVLCRGGINRSSICSTLALMKMGRTAEEAIDFLRKRRSPAVLCNPSFNQWLLTRN